VSFQLYDPISHSLSLLGLRRPIAAKKLISQIRSVVPFQQATIILFAAQFQKTLVCYQNGESLVWRDSGALLATISLVAEAMDLNCCGLGITTEPFLSQALGANTLLSGTGGCLIGRRI
jgi:hypothetical protein